MVLLVSIVHSQVDHVGGEVKTVQEEYIECEINEKRKKWNKLKLANELTKLNHDIICLQTNQFHPFKNICRRDFSFLEQGRKYYTSREKLYAPMSHYITTSSSNALRDGKHCVEKLIEHVVQKRNYKIIFENLRNSPSIQISFCGILITAIVGLLDLRNKKI
ncbi:conserved Plasmodium protein, unknown function [Plasmodium ovale wallikeri]|uniref:Uncharacterized protein n=1 Tax=Plasmodium ovale wallikeri TaxID=864142 RepID=A0A1A8YX96_PLAOA|nr:conserved Plasmodium protein, unknown function [Plasmodium ovale wallikeri]SBT36736.1 conserved Plasmodium protein, unknown function [Plasmodium ovale wallikeri]